jgi:hypothetical protein
MCNRSGRFPPYGPRVASIKAAPRQSEEEPEDLSPEGGDPIGWDRGEASSKNEASRHLLDEAAGSCVVRQVPTTKVCKSVASTQPL